MNVNDLSNAEKAQYKEVASELRCLVCQNQSLADSHASLAVDLKEKIAEQVRAGKSSEEIKGYMQDRYGEFVIYKPAYSLENAVLWIGPFIVLAIAVLLARKAAKGMVLKVKQPLPDSESQWAEKLYQNDKPSKPE